MKLQSKSIKTPVYATPGQRQLRQLDLFFLSKNVILEEPPLQTTYEKMHFLGWNRTLFFA